MQVRAFSTLLYSMLHRNYFKTGMVYTTKLEYVDHKIGMHANAVSNKNCLHL